MIMDGFLQGCVLVGQFFRSLDLVTLVLSSALFLYVNDPVLSKVMDGFWQGWVVVGAFFRWLELVTLVVSPAIFLDVLDPDL